MCILFSLRYYDLTRQVNSCNGIPVGHVIEYMTILGKMGVQLIQITKQYVTGVLFKVLSTMPGSSNASCHIFNDQGGEKVF